MSRAPGKYVAGTMAPAGAALDRPELRHIMTRLSVHEFHHRLYQARSFHEPGPECACIRSGNQCERYHVLSCSLRTESLTRFCNEV
jgi:hypothetical protein